MTAFTRRLRDGLALLLVLSATSALAQDARTWLDRMNRAVEELNYEGTFVHEHGGRVETLHIVHRNDDGRIGERVVSLDGVGREIIRQENNVQCILPDQRTVLVEETNRPSQLASALPSYSSDLESSYELKLHRTARVAKRPTQIVGIKPKDEYRYGYTLWLDMETAMLLKSQLRDENGDVVEQIQFTDFRVSDSIPASALEPTTDTSGFKWVRAGRTNTDVGGDTVSWRALQVPPGFELSVATQRRIAGSKYPVGHLVYSDGLATVSVFIEDPKTQADDVAEGFVRVGGTNAYSLTLSGRKVTVIGEVPRETVHSIATSLGAAE